MALSVAMNAPDTGLHPVSSPLLEAELRFSLRGLARTGETLAVECAYRAHRERDVRKERTLHLLDSVWRSGSRDLIGEHRDESHLTTIAVTASEIGLRFSVPLRSPDPEHRAYGLASVRIGRLMFERWFSAPPPLDPAFGLHCSGERLAGAVRRGGLGGPPLVGSLPLWPTLREIDLEVLPVERPRVELWDPRRKHYWEGWRLTPVQEWPGGQTITARHVSSPTVWRFHEYLFVPSAGTPFPARPQPPGEIPLGVGLEAFWPEGSRIEFPEVYFERPAASLAIPIGRLTPRAREILAASAQPRPGLEPLSVSAAEWAEFEALAPDDIDAPVAWEMKTEGGQDVLVALRAVFTEPWLYLFGVEYDGDRRYAVASLLLRPRRWPGELPPD